MKKLSYTALSIAAALSLCSCNDWLTEIAPGTTDVQDFLSNEAAAVQQATGVYVPLAWEYNTVFYAEWIIGDVCSDDSIKGGESIQNGLEIYDMCNFRTTSNNAVLLDFYRAQYQGIGRANMAIKMISAMPDERIEPRLRERLVGEAKFLRAYYYFRLIRVFGDVPLVTQPVESSNEWKQARVATERIYDQIVQDLTEAEAALWNKNEYAAADLGRATKGAAQAMLLKVNLYRKNWDEAYIWGNTFMKQQKETGLYALNTDFRENFAIEGENGIESVFEVQYVEEGSSDWGGNLPNGANGATRGNMSTKWQRPRNGNILANADGSNITGYGFNKPTLDLWNEYEAGDPRREWTICQMSDADIQTPMQEIFYGNRNTSVKAFGYYSDNGAYNRYVGLGHDTRSPINRREIRLSDVMLLFAEACLESGNDTERGKAALDEVRARVGLPASDALTREAIRHERRVELAMEGHRWFDLCRWGIVAETMNNYRTKYRSKDGEEASDLHIDGDDMSEFVAGKHELFPIPWEEIQLGGLTQNFGY